MGLFKKSCYTNPAPEAVAPNPDPSRWELISCTQFAFAYVLVVKFLDCTNYEGVKVMVYEGQCPSDIEERPLDPHFTENGGPIARFRPTDRGIADAEYHARRFEPCQQFEL